MAITRNISGTIKNQTITIDDRKIPMDHILQTTLTTGLGVIGDPVEVNMTYQMYRLILGKDRASLVGSNIKITIDNTPSDGAEREYFELDGYITHVREYTTAKQNYVWLMCMSKEYIQLSQHRKFVNDDKIHTHEVLRRVLSDCDIEMEVTDDNLSTYWESFGMPMSTPSIDYVKDLLDKDGVLYYSLTDIDGKNKKVYLATWYDINNMLKIVEKMDPNWTYSNDSSTKYLANFGSKNTQWAGATFTKSRQTNTKAPWNVMESDLAHINDIYENIHHQNCYFEDDKDPKYFNAEDGTTSKNPDVLPDDKIYKYTGNDIIKSSIQPYYNNDALFKNDDTPKSRSFISPSNLVWYPKYWHQRMVHSYIGSKRLFRCEVTVAGRLTARAPLTCLQLSYYPNRYYEGGEEQSSAERNKSKIASGLYLITQCTTVISGNNIINKYTMLKPCPENESIGSVDDLGTNSNNFDISVATGSLSEAIEGVSNTIKNPGDIAGAISKVSTTVGDLGNTISNTVGKVTSSVSDIVTNIGGSLGSVGDIVNDPQFSEVIGNVGNVVGKVTEKLEELGVDTSKITDFTNKIENIGQNISSIFDGTVDMQDVRQMASLVGLDEELDKVQEFLGKAQNIYNLGNDFLDNISNVYSTLGNLSNIQDILKQVEEGNFKGSLEELKDILTSVSSSTSGLLGNVQEMTNIAGLDVDLSEFTGVLDKVSDVVGMVQNGFDVFTNIADGMAKGKIDLESVGELVNIVSPETGKVLDNITGLTQQILPSVSKLVDKFGSFEKVKNAINGITTNGVTLEDIQSMGETINEFKEIAQSLGVDTSKIESVNNVIDTISNIRDNYGKIAGKLGDLRIFTHPFDN